MEVADESVCWSSVPAKRTQMPSYWGDWKGKDVLRLKDTRGKYWCNELVAPNQFAYTYPSRNHRSERDAELVESIHARLQKATPLVVHLFSTPGSRDEFYGEWVITHHGTAPGRDNVGVLTLSRLAAQSPSVLRGYTAGPATRCRSHNEVVHGQLLSTLFPEKDWVVRHEPETLMDLHELSVVDGVAVDVTGTTRSYTSDYVIASRHGCGRVCIESKPHVDHVTPQALVKARMLRDRTCTRVVFMVGSGEEVRWIDLGPPPNVETQESSDYMEWYDTAEALCAACGISGGP